MPISLSKSLYRCLVVQKCSHDVTIVGGILGADYYPVTIANGGIYHGISLDAQHEEFSITYNLAGESHDIFNGLLGSDGATSGDSTYQRNGRCLGR